jgi:hypothetical protein
LQSGIFIPGNGKALVAIKTADSYLLVASQNKGPLQVFSPRFQAKVIAFNDNDSYAIVYLKTGAKQKIENYKGASFLSQGSNIITLSPAVIKVEIVDNKGIHRNILP